MREGAVSDGSIVVGRGGWLRLPEEYLRRAGIQTRATARVEGERIVVTSADVGAPLRPATRVALPLAAAAAGGVLLRAAGLVEDVRARLRSHRGGP